MSENYNVERDLKEAEAMASALDSYVRGSALYGSVSGGMFASGTMPSLTVGALLMRLRRLDVLYDDDLSMEQRKRLKAAMRQNETVAREWHVHYIEKLTREAKSRLDAMQAFFEECRSSPKTCANGYRPEALRRTVVQEILLAMPELGIEADDDLRAKIRLTDQQLRAVLMPGDFMWSSELERAYDPDEFWWLYRRPIEGD
jgi:hypothetical protein